MIFRHCHLIVKIKFRHKRLEISALLIWYKIRLNVNWILPFILGYFGLQRYYSTTVNNKIKGKEKIKVKSGGGGLRCFPGFRLPNPRPPSSSFPALPVLFFFVPHHLQPGNPNPRKPSLSARARGGVGDSGVSESSGGSSSVWRQSNPNQGPLFERARGRGGGKEARQWPAVLAASSSWSGLRWTPGAWLVLASNSSSGHGREEESNQWQSNRNPSPNSTQISSFSPFDGSFSLESRWVVSNPELLLISTF